MDKDVAKAVLRDAGVPVARSVTLRADEPREAMAERVAELGYPVFVKPARLGSSVGISRVPDADALDAALDLGFAHDEKLLARSSSPAARWSAACSAIASWRPPPSARS